MNLPQPCSIRAIHYATGKPVEVVMAQGMIKEIREIAAAGSLALPAIAPGLVDLQVNGYGGLDFNSSQLRIADVIDCTRLLLAQGVTTYFPTIITNDPSQIQASLRTIAAACRQSDTVAACMGGIHLEGPFVSPLEGPLGAHDRHFVRAPDWDLFETFYNAAEARIKIITLSPEWPEAVPFIRQCVERGVLISIGHTAATTQQIAAAVTAGAAMSTHLGNGAHPVLPRHPNYIWDQLADDRLAASFIADGFHLPPSVIKIILTVKGRNAVLVSDSVSLAGMPPGAYTTPVGGQVVLTAEGRLHLLDRPHTLAGSAQTLLQGVSNLRRLYPRQEALCWELASLHPARLINLPQQQGLLPGAPADMVLYHCKNGTLEVAGTFKNGIREYNHQNF